MKTQRYQLKKTGIDVIKKRHPWIFRSHLSSAADVFKTGDVLKLVDSENAVIGYGVYDGAGLIAIRVIKFSSTPPSTEWFTSQVQKAIEKRNALRKFTNAFRVIHGENDGFPGVVVELFNDTLVVQVYSASMDRIGRYVSGIVAKELGIQNIILKDPQKRVAAQKREGTYRVLRGMNPQSLKIREGKNTFAVDLLHGQKTGTFLDLRGLRKQVAALDLSGKRVLNLFSYTGTLGLMAEEAKAKQIWNVDISKGALDFAKKFHSHDLKRHRFIEADIFHWLEALSAHELFDCIIVDPPNMGTKKEQVPQILKAYQKLYSLALRHLPKNGLLIACCCTSRISRKEFAFQVDRTLNDPKSHQKKQSHTPMKCFRELKPEDDHPVSFPEGDYLKIRFYR